MVTDIIKRNVVLSNTPKDNLEKLLYYDKLSNATALILGKLLKENDSNKYYKDLGYDSFSEFIAQGGFSFTRRTAYNYIDLWNIYEKYKVKYEEFVEIPYSKILKIKEAINEENYLEWFNKARELSRTDLVLELQEKGYNHDEDEYIPMPKIYLCPVCKKWRIDLKDSEICRCKNNS